MAATEEALLRGFAAAAAALAEGPARVVNLVVVGAAGPLASALAHTVAGWGRGLARELARTGATVNTVLTAAAPDRSAAAGEVASFLAGDEAGFITGQTLGTIDAVPPPKPAAVVVDPGAPRTALVSGGGGDLGMAICRRLVTDGWRVIIGHRPTTDGPALARSLDPDGRRVAAVALDLLDEGSVSAAASRLAHGGGGLQGLVLNAGWTDTGPFSGSAPDDRLRVVRTNLTGAASLLAAVEPLLSPGAVVVGTGSEAGRIGEAGRAVYSGAKAGLAGFLAALDRPGVGAVTFAPGPYDTTLLRETWADPERAEEGIERLRKLVPLRRLGRPEELAAAVAFAMSPAGAGLRGQTVSVGGGITMV